MTKKSLFVIWSLAILLPLGVGAQSIGIPCDGVNVPCDFNALVRLASNIMNFLILISIPLATIAFVWVGIKLLTAGGNPGQVEKAKDIFKKVLIGFLFVLTAWLIVRFITSAILDSSRYQDLLPAPSLPVMHDLELADSEHLV